MRRTLAIALGFFLAAMPAAVLAQDSEAARALKTQLEAIQKQLDELGRKEAAEHKFTEIGAASSRSQKETEPRRVVRVYDLSDLFAIAPAYAAREPADLVDAPRAIFPEVNVEASAGAGLGGGGGFGGGGFGGGGFGGGGFGGGGGLFAVPATISRGTASSATLRQFGGSGTGATESVRTGVDELIDTITTTIEPDAWDEVGGPSTITALGASLVVSAPSETQSQIAALLDLFRKRWGSLRTVSLQAHWLWLTEEQVAGAITAEQQRDPPAPFGALSPEAWKQLREQAQAEGQPRQNYHAALTCYNGQTVHVLAGAQQLVVAGMTPVVGGGEDGAAYQPQVKSIQEGAALQITPVVTRTAKYVVADVHSRVNLLGAAPAGEGGKQDGAVGEVVAAIDRPALSSQRLSTTLRIPVDTPTLVGGMTFGGDDAAPANLYLFLTATVRELKDDEMQDEVSEEVKPAE